MHCEQNGGIFKTNNTILKDLFSAKKKKKKYPVVGSAFQFLLISARFQKSLTVL